MKWITLFLLLLTSPLMADRLIELENIDAAIHDAPSFPDRKNPLEITKKNELKKWSTTIDYEEDQLENGVTYFHIKWLEAEASGAYPVNHCCTEVLFSSLKATNTEWTFFGKIKVGDKESKVIEVLAPVAKKENDKILYCGLNECAVFTVQNGVIIEARMRLYLD